MTSADERDCEEAITDIVTRMRLFGANGSKICRLLHERLGRRWQWVDRHTAYAFHRMIDRAVEQTRPHDEPRHYAAS